ncbi:MAG TPA: hypothetical protein VE547_22660, partial [Mycobacteriales bacterium]|nr:hypothetical protein [Mycobacteriales bacterium]
MEQPKGVTVVLPVYGPDGPVPALLRDLAVAAYALRCRGLHLEVTLLDGSGGAAGERALAAARAVDLPMEVL